MERPILFKDEMINAILDGRKTQTRRIMKPQPDEGLEFTPFAPFGAVNGKGNPLICRHGKTGDRLWVRETWRVGAWHGPAHSRSSDHWIAVDYAADNHARQAWLECPKDMWRRLVDQSMSDANRSAITPDENGSYSWEVGESPCRWRPSIHMPRWASRITLGITSVRVERLQDISEEGAQSEGVEPLRGGYWRHYQPGWTQHTLSAKGSFLTLWNSINGPESWDENPWVWVIEFRRVD